MTEQCLDHVHQQLGSNRTEVPYTSGISRTFENTLMSALIILRDVSPTLSVWEAYSTQTMVKFFSSFPIHKLYILSCPFFSHQDIMGHEAGLESVNVFPGVMISQFENPSI